ncbi:hypothetical protein BD626DRAFT_399710, partial [Schizophyllum amplum]
QAMRRVTRSGMSFSAWDGSTIAVADPQFDLAALVRLSVEEERDELSDEDNDYNIVEPDDDPAWLTEAEEVAPAMPTPPLPPAHANRTRHGHKRAKALRQRNRKRAREDADANEADSEVRLGTRRKHIAAAEPIVRQIAMQKLRVTRTGYTAMRDTTKGKKHHRVYRLQDMVGPDSLFKFELYEWDGRKTVPIVDQQERVFAVLAGSPDKAPDWPGAMQDLADTIDATSSRLTLAANQRRHRRGPFPATAHGHSFGGGQRTPMNIAERPANAALINGLLTHPAMMRVSGFVHGVASCWGPRLMRFYRKYGRRLRARHPHLKRNFRHSAWAAITINHGPRTITLPHRDFSNVPWGWCPITALGRFDYRRGGHLILWDLRLVIQFPPGSTIIIPSSVLTHSNVAIGRHEKRFSITQYTAGGLIRWVDQGFRKKEDYIAALSPSQRAAQAAEAKTRYCDGLALYSTLDELRKLAVGTEAVYDTDLSDLTPLEDEEDDYLLLLKLESHNAHLYRMRSSTSSHVQRQQSQLEILGQTITLRLRTIRQPLSPEDKSRLHVVLVRRLLLPSPTSTMARVSPEASSPLTGHAYPTAAPPPSHPPPNLFPLLPDTAALALPPMGATLPASPLAPSPAPPFSPPAFPLPPPSAQSPEQPTTSPSPAPGPPPPGARERKRKRPAKDKKARLNKKNWADGVRETILRSYLARYADALAKGAWDQVQNVTREACFEYHAQIPWTMPDWEEPSMPLPDYDPKNPPVWPILSEDEEKERSDILTERNAAIQRWLHYRAKKTPGYRHHYRASAQNPYDRHMMNLVGLNPKGTKKALQAIQQYVVENPQLIVDATNAFETAKALGGGSVQFLGKAITKKNINWVMAYIRPTFNALPAAERAGYAERAQKAAQAEKEEWERALKAPPKRDAQSISVFVMGKNSQNLPFSHWDKKRFEKEVLGFYADYLETVWSPAERAAVALRTGDGDGASMSPVDVDDVAGPVGRTRFSKDEISDGEDSDEEEDFSHDILGDMDTDTDVNEERMPRKRGRKKGKATHSTNSPAPPEDPAPSPTAAPSVPPPFDPSRPHQTYEVDNAPPLASGHSRLAWEKEKYKRTIMRMSWRGGAEKREYMRLMDVWEETHLVDEATGVYQGRTSADDGADAAGRSSPVPNPSPREPPPQVQLLSPPPQPRELSATLLSPPSRMTPSTPLPRPVSQQEPYRTSEISTPSSTAPVLNFPLDPLLVAMSAEPIPQPPGSATDNPTAVWFLEAWQYIACRFGNDWSQLLATFGAWEEANAYANARRMKPLPTLGTRPKEMQVWIGKARWTRGGGEPGPKNCVFAERVLRAWWQWYCRLNPSWRRTRPDGTLESCESFESQDLGHLEVCGVNGIFNLVVLLKWIKEGLANDLDSNNRAELDVRWGEAVRDLTVMILHMTKKKSQSDA